MESNITETEYLDLSVDSTWSNDTIIEFIQLIEAEPAIWNPKHKYHKNLFKKSEAWIRVKENFSVQSSVEELKRKRKILMTTYRGILKKLKGSRRSSSDDENSFKHSWFAFDVMHQYLGSVYNCSTIKMDSIPRRKRLLEVETKRERLESRGSDHSGSSDPLQEELEYKVPKRQRLPDVSQQTYEDSMVEERLVGTGNVNTECDLYGQLLAEKLKQVPEDVRLSLMNQIDNLVFKHRMMTRKERILE